MELVGQWIKSIANKLNQLITYKVDEERQNVLNNSSAGMNNNYVTSTPPQEKNYVYSTERKISNSNSMFGQKRYRDWSEGDITPHKDKNDLIITCRKHVNSNIMSAHIKEITSQIIKKNIKRSKTDYKPKKKLYIYSDSLSQEKKKKINQTFELIFEERKRKLNDYFKSK